MHNRLGPVLLIACALSACASVPNDEPVSIGDVNIRGAGLADKRTPLDGAHARALASAVLPFARISKRAYCDYLRKMGAEAEQCDKHSALSPDDGWVALFDSREALGADADETKLTFLVAYRVHTADVSRGDIVFAFRGTKFTLGSDWYANLRWMTRFLPGRDQYEVLYDHMPRLIARALAEASAKAPTVASFDIYSTGHSLGGGLAQLFAFGDKRVKASIVFDPSPVTGYFSVVADDRVNCEAKVLRVYERGEALQYLRSVMRRLYTPTENILEVDFDIMKGGFNPIANHSIAGLTDRLAKGLAALETDLGAAPLTGVQKRSSLEGYLPAKTDGICLRDRRKVSMLPGASGAVDAAP